MTSEEREEFYDAEIAPAILALAQKCENRGLSFVALVDWAPEEVGATGTLAKKPSPQARWTHMASRCKGNVDALIMGIMNEARRTGHSSITLKMLGVPEVPDPT